MTMTPERIKEMVIAEKAQLEKELEVAFKKFEPEIEDAIKKLEIKVAIPVPELSFEIKDERKIEFFADFISSKKYKVEVEAGKYYLEL